MAARVIDLVRFTSVVRMLAGVVGVVLPSPAPQRLCGKSGVEYCTALPFAMGVTLGHLTESHLGLVTLVGIVTIVGSTLMILHSGRLFALLGPLLRPFERRVPQRELSDESMVPTAVPDVVLIGLGRFGGEIARHLRGRGVNILGLDLRDSGSDPGGGGGARNRR